LSEQNLILDAILSEIAKNPPPVEINEEEIIQIIKILEKNQFRINRSHCRDKITRIVNRIIEE
jgi:hypothetical protein